MASLRPALLGLALLLLGVGRSAAQAPSGDWPQWRGPERDGRVKGQPWPEGFQGERLVEVWNAQLGKGYSGPVLSGDRVFVTESVDGKKEVVRALNRRTGAELWRAEWPGELKVPAIALRRGAWIKATPATDGKNLYVVGMREVLFCLDAATGAEKWKIDFPAVYQTPVPSFGSVNSPLLDGDFVYFMAANSVLKIEKETGKVLWRAEDQPEKPEDGAMSSLAMATVGGKKTLLAQFPARMAGIDPEAGKELWSGLADKTVGPAIMTPVVYGEAILNSSGGNRTGLYEVRAAEGGPSLARLWEHKAVVYMSSPIIVGDYAYLHMKNMRIACLDLKTGKEQWISSQQFGQHVSMAAQGDRILLLSDAGDLYLLRANPERLEVLDQRHVADAESWAYLALGGDELYVRDLNSIKAFKWSEPKAANAPVN